MQSMLQIVMCTPRFSTQGPRGAHVPSRLLWVPASVPGRMEWLMWAAIRELNTAIIWQAVEDHFQIENQLITMSFELWWPKNVVIALCEIAQHHRNLWNPRHDYAQA